MRLKNPDEKNIYIYLYVLKKAHKILDFIEVYFNLIFNIKIYLFFIRFWVINLIDTYK